MNMKPRGEMKVQLKLIRTAPSIEFCRHSNKNWTENHMQGAIPQSFDSLAPLAAEKSVLELYLFAILCYLHI